MYCSYSSNTESVLGMKKVKQSQFCPLWLQNGLLHKQLLWLQNNLFAPGRKTMNLQRCINVSCESDDTQMSNHYVHVDKSQGLSAQIHHFSFILLFGLVNISTENVLQFVHLHLVMRTSHDHSRAHDKETLTRFMPNIRSASVLFINQ